MLVNFLDSTLFTRSFAYLTSYFLLILQWLRKENVQQSVDQIICQKRFEPSLARNGGQSGGDQRFVQHGPLLAFELVVIP